MLETTYLDTLRQFVLAGESKDLRAELYEIMTMTVLCKFGGIIKSLNKDQIIKNIGIHFKLKDIPEIHVINSLKRLEENGVIRATGKIFSISEEQCSILNNETEKTKKIELQVREDLQNKIKADFKGVGEETIQQIIDNFFETLMMTLENYGSYAARLFSTEPENTDALNEINGFSQLFKKSVLRIIPSQYHETLTNIISDFFFNPTKELSQYLYSMSIAYTFTKVLNADPNLQKMSSQSWKDKEIIIDTNVIIDLLFTTSELHESIKTILTKTQDLGMKIFVLEETVIEFQSWLSYMKEQHQFVGRGSTVKIDQDLFKNDLFLNEFHNERSSNKLVTINDFASNFEKAKFLLENNFGIQVIPSNIRPKEIDDKLLESIRKSSVYGGKKKNAQIHDAIALEFVKRKRKMSKIDETGPSIWFLTEDNTLNQSERSYYGKKPIFNSIKNEIWLQIIMPFISPKFDEVTANIFAKTLSSNFIIRKVTTKNIIKILSTIWRSEGLKEEQIKQIISDQHISKCFENLDKASELNDESKINSELKNITKSLDKKYLQRIKKLEHSVDQLKNNALDKKKQHVVEKTQLNSSHEKEKTAIISKNRIKIILIIGVVCIGILDVSVLLLYPVLVEESTDGLIIKIDPVKNFPDQYLINGGEIINSAREKHVVPDDPLIYSISIENPLDLDRKVGYTLQTLKGGTVETELDSFWNIGPHETMVREIPFFLHEEGIYKLKLKLMFDVNRDADGLSELGFENYPNKTIYIENFEVISSNVILQNESNDLQTIGIIIGLITLIMSIPIIRTFKKNF